MLPRLQVVGLGPAGIEYLTIGTYSLLKRAEKIFVRTKQHPCVQELLSEGLPIISFDDLYAQKKSFEEVYAAITESLIRELERCPEVIYAVPGHPLVAEKTGELLRDKLSGKADVIIHPAVSFLDLAFGQIPFDPAAGLLLRDHNDLQALSLTGKEWLIITQVYDKMVAAEVKLDLMRLYPDEFEVKVVNALGTAEEKVCSVPLCELDHRQFNHLSSVIVPPYAGAASLAKLAEVMEKLRSPEGCPWDREQDRLSLKKYLLEESYEVLDAIDSQDVYNLCEELGDLLLQIVFHAQIAAENNEFDLQDVLEGIIHKLIRRHPHVFADVKADTAKEVVRNWEEIKRKEKQQVALAAGDIFSGAEKSLPALMLAERVQKKAARLGFDWPNQDGPLSKIREEMDELHEAVQKGRGINEEFGDLLFALVNLARFLNLDPEDALRQSIRKFQRRFRKMTEYIKADDLILEEISLETMDKYWERVKFEEKCGNITYV